jgi:hypothetical protein
VGGWWVVGGGGGGGWGVGGGGAALAPPLAPVGASSIRVAKKNARCLGLPELLRKQASGLAGMT